MFDIDAEVTRPSLKPRLDFSMLFVPPFCFLSDNAVVSGLERNNLCGRWIDSPRV